MGLQTWVHWLAQFITSGLIVTTSGVIITTILSVGSIFPHSDPVVLMLLNEIFALSSIAFSFMISTFFSKAKVAAACSGVLYFTCYLPYVFLARNEDSLSSGAKRAMCLLSPTAFAFSCNLVSTLEQEGTGLHWGTLNSSAGLCGNFTVGDTMGMMLLDTVLYLLIALYIDQV